MHSALEAQCPLPRQRVHELLEGEGLDPDLAVGEHPIPEDDKLARGYVCNELAAVQGDLEFVKRDLAKALGIKEVKK